MVSENATFGRRYTRLGNRILHRPAFETGSVDRQPTASCRDKDSTISSMTWSTALTIALSTISFISLILYPSYAGWPYIRGELRQVLPARCARKRTRRSPARSGAYPKCVVKAGKLKGSYGLGSYGDTVHYTVSPSSSGSWSTSPFCNV